MIINNLLKVIFLDMYEKENKCKQKHIPIMLMSYIYKLREGYAMLYSVLHTCNLCFCFSVFYCCL